MHFIRRWRSPTIWPRTDMALTMDAPAAGDREARARHVVLLLALLLLVAMAASLSVGPSGLSAGSVVSLIGDVLGGRVGSKLTVEHVILFDIRLPRTLLGVLVGGALAVAGALMQGLFRNPLADPGLV